jgi:hypothetical protein
MQIQSFKWYLDYWNQWNNSCVNLPISLSMALQPLWTLAAFQFPHLNTDDTTPWTGVCVNYIFLKTWTSVQTSENNRTSGLYMGDSCCITVYGADGLFRNMSLHFTRISMWRTYMVNVEFRWQYGDARSFRAYCHSFKESTYICKRPRHSSSG